MCDVAVFSAAQTGPKTKPEDARKQVALMLSVAKALGYKFSTKHRVLDFGCGIGDSVGELLTLGFDAYGVDVGEWWGNDFPAYWHDSPIPEERIRKRLSATSEANYRLPYPDHHFELIISSQVFEHVFNYTDVFRELKRVLKPGGVSVHVFPGSTLLPEPHLGIPVTMLCKYEWWLRIWAFLMREDFRTWRGKMKSNNYPSRRALERHARDAGVTLTFHEPLYVEASKGRPWKLLRGRIGRLLRPLVLNLCQRCIRIS